MELYLTKTNFNLLLKELKKLYIPCKKKYF